MRLIVPLTAICLAASSGSYAAETVSLPVTPAHERLVVALWEGEVTVTSGSEDTLRVDADCEPREPQAADNDGGFRSLRSSAVLPGIVAWWHAP